MDFIRRHIADQVREGLRDRPVILLNGARQTGKSTLVKWICKGRSISYLTLDDFTVLSAAKNDPAGFISGIEGPVAIDEVQRVPELLLAIKEAVDRERTPGRFLLTGSANVMFLPRLADTLVGRMEIIPLWPFSSGEINGRREGFIDALFSERLPAYGEQPVDRLKFFDDILTGGYPEALNQRSGRRRAEWFHSYIATLLQREVRDLARIEGLSEMPRLLSLVAARSGSLVSVSELSRSLGMPQMTLKRYVSLLRAVFIIQVLPAWSGNIGKRLIKTPKIFLNDTGLLGSLSGLNTDRLKRNPDLSGTLLENYVMQELSKQQGWSRTSISLYYYRTAGGKKVDFVLQAADGRIAAIEVKAASTVWQSDLKGIQDLADNVGKRFHRGVILYLGNRTVPFAENLHAVPVRSLWT